MSFLLHTSGSEGGLGGQPPRFTRPRGPTHAMLLENGRPFLDAWPFDIATQHDMRVIYYAEHSALMSSSSAHLVEFEGQQ